MERIILHHDVRIWTTMSGKGTPVILCNGGPGCDDYLAPVAEMLADRCQVVRFEPRGCGRSDFDGRYDLETTIGDVERIRREYGFGKCIVGGHSAGGGVALAYALAHPTEVLGILSIAGGGVVNDRDWSRAYHDNLERVGEDVAGREFVADEAVNAVGNATWKEFIKHPLLMQRISRLEIPAFFVYGTADIRPSWPTEQLAHLLPEGRYIPIEGAAHWIWLTHARELDAVLKDCVRQLTGQGFH